MAQVFRLRSVIRQSGLTRDQLLYYLFQRFKKLLGSNSIRSFALTS